MGKGDDSMCGENKRFQIRGNSSSCSLVVQSPTVSDHGVWTCAVSDDRSLETQKDYRHLDIAVEGKVSLSPSHSILELGEGDMADLLCTVDEGFPKPSISWGVDRELWGVLNTGSQVFRETSQGSHLVSVSQRVSYLASARDNGLNISCTSTQTEMGDIVHFSQTRSIQLKILPVTAMKSKLSERLGMLTVIFISVLLVILVMVIITMVGLRRKRGSKGRHVESVDLLKPVWSIKDHESQNNFAVRQAELYEPLNVSFIDLYHTVAADQKLSKSLCESNDKTIHSNSSTFSSKDACKDDSSGLGSSAASDSLCIVADIEIDTKSIKMYKETHFDNPSPPPPPPPPSHHHHCPCKDSSHTPHSLHSIHSVHTIDRSQAHTTPHTLFHCQHRCFQHQELPFCQ